MHNFGNMFNNVNILFSKYILIKHRFIFLTSD
ncbi:unnamed protein product [Larinioides sclopetarius]|uniref:Uncharacterized protein n=1 Tax=Larinioides sclopetarius TaxID=280406 RepID=A0AAV2A402_9ARAC